MSEVVPGIYRFKLPLPTRDAYLGYVNVYLVRGRDGYLMVDTGWNTDEAYAALEKQLGEAGINIGEITQVVVTHIHPDHYGLVGRLKQLAHPTFYLHHLEMGLIQDRYIDMEPLLRQTDRWLHLNGVPEGLIPSLQRASVDMAKKFVSYIYPDYTLNGGETISTSDFNFKVIWAPGHSPGQVCLHETEKKILFSGDHILPSITPNIGLHPQSSANPIDDFLRSLREIRQLKVDLVLPGHEEPFGGLKTRVDQIIKHHDRRIANIMKALNGKPKTAFGVANEIPWLTDETNGRSWQSLGPLDRRLAVLETLAHLEMLRIEGKVAKSYKEHVFYHKI